MAGLEITEVIESLLSREDTASGRTLVPPARVSL